MASKDLPNNNNKKLLSNELKVLFSDGTNSTTGGPSPQSTQHESVIQIVSSSQPSKARAPVYKANDNEATSKKGGQGQMIEMNPVVSSRQAPSSSSNGPSNNHDGNMASRNRAAFANHPSASTQSDEIVNASMTQLNLSQLNDAYIVDDLSQLPLIDDRNLVASIKSKFESKKYYVSKSYRIRGISFFF